jgi:metal-responsive CopG/Arc/MetJ family transcriptional regulator
MSYKRSWKEILTVNLEKVQYVDAYIPKELVKKIDELAKKQDRTRSSYLRIAMTEHLKKIENKEKASVGAALSGTPTTSQSVVTME